MGRSGSKKTSATGAVRRQAAPFSNPPVVALPLLWHIGTLNESTRGANYGDSYEGHALSVSRDPDEWERIAKIGGNPWWLLRNRDARFLNAYELTDEQREQVIDWAVANNYAERVEMYEATLGYDDELEQERVMLVETYAEAVEEVKLEELDASVIVPRASFRTTDLFLERIGGRSGMLHDLDRVLMLYVDEQHPELDGVWWEANYGWMSAPRGGILPSRLPRWQRRLMREPRTR